MTTDSLSRAFVADIAGFEAAHVAVQRGDLLGHQAGAARIAGGERPHVRQRFAQGGDILDALLTEREESR